MTFGIGETQEVKPRKTDERRYNVIHCIDINETTEIAVDKIQVDIDAMSDKGFKPVLTTLDTENQLYYILYGRNSLG
jgi:hypothetical protein